MDVVAAYERVGTCRGAAANSGVDPKTVKRKIEATIEVGTVHLVPGPASVAVPMA